MNYKKIERRRKEVRRRKEKKGEERKKKERRKEKKENRKKESLREVDKTFREMNTVVQYIYNLNIEATHAAHKIYKRGELTLNCIKNNFLLV